jgi:hypothetical protein
MQNVPVSFLIYLLYFKNSQLLNRCERNPSVYDVFDSESALELNPEVVTSTPGTLCICYMDPDRPQHDRTGACVIAQ